MRAAVEYVRAQGKRVVGLVGHSKGGSEVILYAAKYNDVPKVVNISGRFDNKRGAALELHKRLLLCAPTKYAPKLHVTRAPEQQYVAPSHHLALVPDQQTCLQTCSCMVLSELDIDHLPGYMMHGVLLNMDVVGVSPVRSFSHLLCRHHRALWEGHL